MSIATTVKQQAWFSTKDYPFKSNYIQIQGKAMHYVDEGQGEVILMVHGTPVWSFVYRKMIQHFAKTHRCIAPDHLGFGLSEKSEDINASAPQLAYNLEEFIHKLGLKNITLIVHDFGGPIGLYYALQHAPNVKKIVLMNTWFWKTKDLPDAQKIDKILHSRLGKFLYLYLNFSPKFLIPKAFHNQKALTKKIHQHYIKVFPSKKERKGLLQIGQSIIGASDWYEEQWANIEAIQHKPFLVLWGMKDSFITPSYLEIWKQTLSNATFETYNCGHFVQEEQSLDIIHRIEAFI